jgi:hypothetical protein
MAGLLLNLRDPDTLSMFAQCSISAFSHRSALDGPGLAR